MSKSLNLRYSRIFIEEMLTKDLIKLINWQKRHLVLFSNACFWSSNYDAKQKSDTFLHFYRLYYEWNTAEYISWWRIVSKLLVLLLVDPCVVFCSNNSTRHVSYFFFFSFFHRESCQFLTLFFMLHDYFQKNFSTIRLQRSSYLT